LCAALPDDSLGSTIAMSRVNRLSIARMLRAALLTGAALLVLCALPARGEDKTAAPIKVGTKLERLTVDDKTYTQVQVKSVSARSVIITHSGGMASLRLRDLAPELQASFGYDPAAESAREHALQQANEERQAKLAADIRAARQAGATKPVARSKFEQVLEDFGRPAKIEAEVDLRPRFRELELHAKNQGRRPSCAVFAVVSALEFINADRVGRTEKLSEEYLIWATYKSIQRPVPDEAAFTRASEDEDADTGFALIEVVMALRSYGIPLQSTMPNTFGRFVSQIADPAPQIVAEARQRAHVAVHLVPGRDNATLLNNIVHALNANLPVAIGAAWPRFYKLKAAMLSTQDPIPGSGHAVTLVGYTSKSGRIEDAVFIFKNSWGVSWGAGGYGFASYAYLEKHLQDAVLLEVSPRG
jgi:C1A family cysteine protease